MTIEGMHFKREIEYPCGEAIKLKGKEKEQHITECKECRKLIRNIRNAMS